MTRLAAALGVALALAPGVAGAAEEPAWDEAVPRFRWWEYAGTAALLGGSLALRFTVDVGGEPTWASGFVGDDAIYDAFMIRTPHRFRSWRTVGDIGYLSSYAWSALDPLIAGFAHDWDTALQMTLMNLEAFSVYSMVLSVSQIIVRRERPVTRECADPTLAGELGISCSGQNVNRAFIGGHAGTVATAATLTCLHHIYQPLWGGARADALPCVTFSALTFVVGTSRTVTGQHNLSDNLLGVGVGVMSGLVPWALHYAIPWWSKKRLEKQKQPALVQPTAVGLLPGADGGGMQVSGLLF